MSFRGHKLFFLVAALYFVIFAFAAAHAAVEPQTAGENALEIHPRLTGRKMLVRIYLYPKP